MLRTTFCLCLLWANFAPLVAAPTPDEIKKAIADLANNRFAVREKASKLLWEAGAAAEPALREAAKSSDEETAKRAQTILEKFDWGIYPDTPANVTMLIEAFRGGDEEARAEAIIKLLRLRPVRVSTIKRLISKEFNEDFRQELFNVASSEARRMVPGLILANKLDEADETLEMCLTPKSHNALSDYAAFNALRKNLPATIKRLEDLRRSEGLPERAKAIEALVYVHRVRRDWPAARAMAKEAADVSKNEFLSGNIAWESDDWKALAAQEALLNDPNDTRVEQSAYHRMAGDIAKSDELIDQMRKDVEGVEGGGRQALALARALLVNGKSTEAITILKRHRNADPAMAFDFLCAQMKFREAFAFATDVEKQMVGENDNELAESLYRLKLVKARVLAGLGDRDAAIQIFRGLRDDLVNDRLIGRLQESPYRLVQVILRAGMRDLAIETIATLSAKDEDESPLEMRLLTPLVEDRADVTYLWWSALRLKRGKDQHQQSLRDALALADGKGDRKLVDEVVKAMDKLVEKDNEKREIPEKGNEGRWPRWAIEYAAGVAYRRIEAVDMAEKYFKQSIKTSEPKAKEKKDNGIDDEIEAGRNLMAVFGLGDIYLSTKRYKEAAVEFRKAHELAPVKPIYLFLEGHALALAGDEAEGKRRMELSHWIALGDESTRYEFSEALSKRGFEQDSRREADLIMELGWFDSDTMVGNTYLRVARQKARQGDLAMASKLYQKEVIGLERSMSTYIDPRGHLTVPELARTYRARALLAGDKVDEALGEARVALESLPGNVDLAIGLVPELAKKKRQKEADDLYGKVREAHEQALKEYANSPELHNGLAWTMVNCNRDLNEALKHAQKAVEVAPAQAGYLDTLAEVHFRLKDRAKALELMKKCASMEPSNAYFRKQLIRFESKPFDSPLPDEETGDD